MGAKEALVLSQHKDRETGTSLVPHPEYMLRDYERGAQWRPDVTHSMRTGHIDMPGPKLNEQPRDVQARLSRGKGLYKQGRRGVVMQANSEKYSYQVQTTKEFKEGRWPLDRANGYHGTIIMEDGRLAGGDCTCPDHQKGGAQWRGFTLCKHMVWAVYMMREGSYELNDHVELWLEYSDRHGGNILDAVRENGQKRSPFIGETLPAKREELHRQGYTKARTVIGIDDDDHRWLKEVFVHHA